MRKLSYIYLCSVKRYEIIAGLGNVLALRYVVRRLRSYLRSLRRVGVAGCSDSGLGARGCVSLLLYESLWVLVCLRVCHRILVPWARCRG